MKYSCFGWVFLHLKKTFVAFIKQINKFLNLKEKNINKFKNQPPSFYWALSKITM